MRNKALIALLFTCICLSACGKTSNTVDVPAADTHKEDAVELLADNTQDSVKEEVADPVTSEALNTVSTDDISVTYDPKKWNADASFGNVYLIYRGGSSGNAEVNVTVEDADPAKKIEALSERLDQPAEQSSTVIAGVDCSLVSSATEMYYVGDYNGRCLIVNAKITESSDVVMDDISELIEGIELI